jgi:hypothetical protein
MTRTLTVIALAVSAALAGCNQGDSTIVAGEIDDPMGDELANAAPVELPPSIQASKQYRCRDNSIVYVDWLSDGKSANIRTDRHASPTRVTAEEAGKPFVAEGYSVTGSATAASVTVNGKSCKA